jgi:hypothetical protein
MSRYINVGAKYNGVDIPTKKRLKELCAAEPDKVFIYGTSDHVLNLSSEYTYTVTGPNPYTSRKWYASLTVSNGKVTIK